MNRKKYIDALGRALGRRRLAYFGTRGADARSLTDLPNFEQIFSQIAPSGMAGVGEHCLEPATAERVDLDTYSIDEDTRGEVIDLRGTMLDFFEMRTAVLPYRSCALLASACFPRSDTALHLGNFHQKQSCFEHKPWVERSLAAAGVEAVPWRYFADNERELIQEMLTRNALVVRANRSDGGTGVRFVPRDGDLAAAWPEHGDGFVAVAPFLDGYPLNANACVFADGSVAVFGASMQLVGIASCTSRRFGYCGNDFAAVGAIGDDGLRQFDAMLRRVGRWLVTEGYRGAFGVDALFVAGRVVLVELNPRFQGSSRLAAAADMRADRADQFLAHAGAHLGLGPPDDATLADLAAEHTQAHIVVHAPFDGRWKAMPRVRGFLLDLDAEPEVTVRSGAMVCDLVHEGAVTTRGDALTEAAEAAVTRVLGSFAPVEEVVDG